MNGFIGGDAHWRVLPLRKVGPHGFGLAMTEAHRLARLNRG